MKIRQARKLVKRLGSRHRSDRARKAYATCMRSQRRIYGMGGMVGRWTMCSIDFIGPPLWFQMR